MIDLNLPTPDGEYVLYTDASNIGMSAILHQRQDDGEVPILCISKKLDIHQQKYSYIVSTSRLGRWALSLQGHSFSVEHVKGSENTVTDYFSRHFKT